MSSSLQLPEGSPWRTIVRVSLLLLSEGALIAMLRDAPPLFLFATAVVPLLAVIVLELEGKFKANKQWLFATSIVFLAVVYGGFVTYAIKHSIAETAKRENIHTYDQDHWNSQHPSEEPIHLPMDLT